MQYEDGEAFVSNVIQYSSDVEFGLPLGLDDELQSESYDDETNSSKEDDDLFNEIRSIDDDEISIKLPKQRRCLSHLLNLIANDSVNKLNGRAKSAYVRTFSKLQTIWVFPRESALAATICKEVFGCKLKIPCETRWNSRFDAVKQLFSLKHKINEYVEKVKSITKNASQLSLLSDEDEYLMSAYLKVFEPVANALDRLQGEKNCGQGFILPTLYAMRYRVENMSGSGNIAKVFQETMLKVIDERFETYFKINENNSELYVAAMSIPRFKSTFIKRDIVFLQI